MDPNCKQCLTFPICVNLLKQNLITYSYNPTSTYYQQSIKIGKLVKKCSIFNNYTRYNYEIIISKYIVELLQLNIEPSKLYISYSEF